MAHQRLTDALCRKAEPPTTRRSRILWDGALPGFGLRTTKLNGPGEPDQSGGTKSFILFYRTRIGQRQRMLTIGRFPTFSVAQARTRAEALMREVASGGDPMGELHSARQAPTMAELCDRYLKEVSSAKRPSTDTDNRSYIRQFIMPVLGARKVAEITESDISKLHRTITEKGLQAPGSKRKPRPTPIRANRCVGMLRHMFNCAIRWKLRTDNPATGIARNEEQARSRYLTPDEIGRLVAVLDKLTTPSGYALKLLLLTGARRGETLSATWLQFDLDAGIWTKPGHATKSRKNHVVPLSAPARDLLVKLKAKAKGDLVFPAPHDDGKPQVDLRKTWLSVCKDAGISDARIHDLRHSFASILASGGVPLLTIGRLLGHTQASTTNRYSHLFADTLREATEVAGALIVPPAPAPQKAKGTRKPSRRR